MRGRGVWGYSKGRDESMGVMWLHQMGDKSMVKGLTPKESL